MVVFPNAKINLGLYVTAKRQDGYHNIESLFLPVSLCDVLEAIPSNDPGCKLFLKGHQVDGDVGNNLCVRAYDLIQQRFDIPGIEACLLKNIPLGAGLGGGSADGAFMIRLLNDLFNLGMSIDQMKNLAGLLGSDCPFFIANTQAFVSGRGELLEPVDTGLTGKKLLIVHPGIHISTAMAYAHILPKSAAVDLRQLNVTGRQEWQTAVSNDFETYMLKQYPEIAEIKHSLYEMGAFYASMSGSGSSVYGLFDGEADESVFNNKYFAAKCEIL
jgi:4-diphosphocytidyl-2-C-methyl-D-erythritol kinase